MAFVYFLYLTKRPQSIILIKGPKCFLRWDQQILGVVHEDGTKKNTTLTKIMILFTLECRFNDVRKSWAKITPDPCALYNRQGVLQILVYNIKNTLTLSNLFVEYRYQGISIVPI